MYYTKLDIVTKTEVYISYGYGAWKIRFKKEFNLPFVPFYDIILYDNNDGYENTIRLGNTDYQTTDIMYDTNSNKFNISVRNVWRQPVSDTTIDDILKMFENTHWIRTDNTDISKFKELMNRNNKLGM